MMKGDTEVFLMIIFCMLGFTLGIYTNLQELPANMNFLDSIATLIAAFSGSWVAFKLHENHQIREERKQNITSANKVLSGLLMQANTLKNYEEQFITNARNEPGRHISIQPSLPYDITNPNIDTESLHFLEKVTHRQIVYELNVECSRYKDILQAINERSRLYRYDVQPSIAKAGLKNGASYTESDFLSAIGELNYISLKTITDQIISLVDDAIKQNDRIKIEFIKCIKDVYPDAKLFTYEFKTS